MTRFVVLLLIAFVSTAHAQPTAEDKQAAKDAFKRAEAAEKRKDWRTAIEEYQAAYDAVPHPDVLYNIAVDFERLEEYRDAATYYRRYLDESGDDANDRNRVEGLIEKLRNRPGEVTIESDPAGARVKIDGKVAGKTPLITKLSGRRTVEIEGPDGSWTEREVEVEYGEPESVRIGLTERTGILVINSNVAGASVTVDGVVVGTTPFQGAVPAGSRKVVVASPGWSSTERQVDVPSDGAAQITANLVRPVGFVEPVPPAPESRVYFAIDGGADVLGEGGGLYELLFGARRGQFDFALGYGYSGNSAAFALQTRVRFSSGNVQPYLRAALLIGSSTLVTGHAGVLIGIPKKDYQRYQMWLYADVGGGYVRTGSTDANTERSAVVPIVGGVQFSY
jgi:hypothetical protein